MYKKKHTLPSPMRAVTCTKKHPLPSLMNAVTIKAPTAIAHERYYPKPSLINTVTKQNTHYYHSLTLLPNKAPTTFTHERCYKKKTHSLPSLMNGVTKTKAPTTITH